MKLGVLNPKFKESDLENYNGYLPQILMDYIDKEKYYKNIEKSENKEEIYAKLRMSHLYSFKEHMEDLKTWLKDNPEFEDIIEIES